MGQPSSVRAADIHSHLRALTFQLRNSASSAPNQSITALTLRHQAPNALVYAQRSHGSSGFPWEPPGPYACHVPSTRHKGSLLLNVAAAACIPHHSACDPISFAKNSAAIQPILPYRLVPFAASRLLILSIVRCNAILTSPLLNVSRS